MLNAKTNQTIEILEQIQREINRDWTPVYSAIIDNDGNLIVLYEGEECAYITTSLEVGGTDEDAIDQLNYYLSR